MEKKPQRICILSFADMSRESRVLNQINAISNHYKVDVIGYGQWQPPDNVTYFQVPKNKRSKIFMIGYTSLLILAKLFPVFYEIAFWLKKEYSIAVKYLSIGNYVLIHANDWESLLVAEKGSDRKKSIIIFDAHEYSPDQESEKWIWRILVKPYKVYILKKHLHSANKVITVSEGISRLYFEEFNIESQIIMNARTLISVTFIPTNNKRIQLIHHGFALPGRKLEDLIYMIAKSDSRFILNLMLIAGNQYNYLQKLKMIAKKVAPGRIIFHNPVDPSLIISFINKFDLGIPFLKAKNENILHSLPHNFFDFIVAGLGVVVSPLPDLAGIINQYGIGRVAASQSPEDMAAILNSLNADDINRFKRNSLKLAKMYNAENEMKKLLGIYQELLAD